MASMLDIREIYRFYRSGEEEVMALRGVSLNVDKGRLVAVVGPSGSGKSTLLSIAAGTDDPDGGSVRIDGTRLSHVTERARARLRARLVGVLAQNGNLLDHLTVAGNVRLAQTLAGRRDRERIDDVIAGVGLSHRAHAYPAQLSGGESARAGLAVALVNEPPVVIADEPTGELDEDSEHQLIKLLAARADAGAVVVVASHSMTVAERADQIVRLHDGRLS